MKKAIFLDRDGVLNKLVIREGKAQAPYSLSEFELYFGVQDALIQIKKKGYLAIVVTNQPDVARGWVTKEKVELINNEILKILPIDAIKICFHTNSDRCLCRKPMPGMLQEAGLEWGISLSDSFMIGDRYSDIAAGASVGCKTILVSSGANKADQLDYPNPNYYVSSLIEAVQFI
jgi:D-glycero-D-manno-heptose 1,7-bisphosphate phosphatase